MADKDFLDFDVSSYDSYQMSENKDDMSEAEEYDLDDFTNEETNDFYLNHFTQASRKTKDDNPPKTLPAKDNLSQTEHKRVHLHQKHRSDRDKPTSTRNSESVGALSNDQVDAFGIQNVSMLQVDKFFQDLDNVSGNSSNQHGNSRSSERTTSSPDTGSLTRNVPDDSKVSRNGNGIVEQLSVAKSQFLEAKENLQKLLAPGKQELEYRGKKVPNSLHSSQTMTDKSKVNQQDSGKKNDGKRTSVGTVKKVRFLQQTRSSDDSEGDLEDGELDNDMMEYFEIDDDIPGGDNDDDCKENHVPDGRASTGAILENSHSVIVGDGFKDGLMDVQFGNSSSVSEKTCTIQNMESLNRQTETSKQKSLSLKSVHKGVSSNSSQEQDLKDRRNNIDDSNADENLWQIVESAKSVGNVPKTQKVHSDERKSRNLPDTEADDGIPGSVEQKVIEAATGGNLDALKSSKMTHDSLKRVRDDRGNTLLHITAKHGRMDCLQWLVMNGCHGLILVDNDEAQTPAVAAVKHGQIECLQWLVLESEARKQLILDDNKPALIHQAARYGQESCLRWLLGYMQMQDLSIDITDLHGNSAVHLAAKYGHLSCLQTLVEFNADVTATNKKGHTPCKVAANHHHDTSAQFLIVVESCISLAEQVTNYRRELREVKQENLVLRSRLDDLQVEYVDLTGKLVKQLDDLYQKKTVHRSRTSSLENSGSEEKLGAEIAASKEKAEALRRRCADLTEQERQLKEKERVKMQQEKKSKQKLDAFISESLKHSAFVDDNFGLEPLNVMRARLREVSHRLMVYHNAKTVHDREVLNATSHDSLSSRSSLSSLTSLSPAISPRTSVSSLHSPPGTMPRYASYNSLFIPKNTTPNHRRHSDGHKAESYFTEPVTLSQEHPDVFPVHNQDNLGKYGSVPNISSTKSSHSMESLSTANKGLDFDIPCIEIQENTQEKKYSMEKKAAIPDMSREPDHEADSISPVLTPVDNDSVFEEYSIENIFPGSHSDSRMDEADEYVYLSGGTAANQRGLIEHVTPGNQSPGRVSGQSSVQQSSMNRKDVYDSRKTSSPSLSSSSMESLDSGSKKRGSTGSSHSEGLYDSVGSDGKPIPESIPQWILMSNKRGRPEPIIEKIGSSTENLKMTFAKHLPAQQLDMIRRMDECMRKVQPTSVVTTTADGQQGQGVHVWMGKHLVDMPENLAAEMDESEKEKNGQSKIKLKRRTNKERRIKFAGFKGSGSRNGSDENSVKEFLAPILEIPGKSPEKSSREDLSGIKNRRVAEEIVEGISGNSKQGLMQEKYEQVINRGQADTGMKHPESSQKIPEHDVNMKSMEQEREKARIHNVRKVEISRTGNKPGSVGHIPGFQSDIRTSGDSKPLSSPTGIRIIRKETKATNSMESKSANSVNQRQENNIDGKSENDVTVDRGDVSNRDQLPVAMVNGEPKVPFDLSDSPSNEFDSFFSSPMPNEEDTGKAWYESSEDDESLEPTPRPKTSTKKSTKSLGHREKGNKHIYFL